MLERFPVPFEEKALSGRILAFGATKWTSPEVIVPWPNATYGEPSRIAFGHGTMTSGLVHLVAPGSHRAVAERDVWRAVQNRGHPRSILGRDSGRLAIRRV